MKFARKIFFTRGPYNDPGTLVGLFWELSDNFYEILIIIFRLLVLLRFWHISRENDEMLWTNIFHQRTVQ